MGLKLIGQLGASAPPLPRITCPMLPMLCCGRLDPTEYPGFFITSGNQHGGYDERMSSVRKSSIFGEFLPVSTVRMTIFVKLIFQNLEEECLKLKLYCSYGRLERSVFRQLVVLNSLPRLVLASFVVSLACLLPLNLDGTDKIYDGHFIEYLTAYANHNLWVFTGRYLDGRWLSLLKVSFWGQYQKRCPFLSLQFFPLYREVDSLWIIFRFTASTTQ